MESAFSIYQSSSDKNRPPISYEVRKYLERFITDNVLKEKKIIVNSDWNVVLGIIFLSEGGRFTSKSIFLPKGGPKIIKKGRIKLYEIIVPLKVIQEANDPYLKTIELMYTAIGIFLSTTYKKVDPGSWDKLGKKIDLDYLLSLPYPAPLEEQKYVGDLQEPDGEVRVIQF